MPRSPGSGLKKPCSQSRTIFPPAPGTPPAALVTPSSRPRPAPAAGSGGDHVRVVAEVHPGRLGGADAAEGGGPGIPVFGLPGRQLLLVRARVQLRGVGGV